jgi:hypothetical protein
MTTLLLLVAFVWLAALTGWLVLERGRTPGPPLDPDLRAHLRARILTRLAQGPTPTEQVLLQTGRDLLRARLAAKAAKHAAR